MSLTFTSKDYSPADLVMMRRKLGLSVAEFWGAIGLPKDIGDAYEAGQPLPPPLPPLPALVCVAIELVHELDCDISTPENRLRLASIVHRDQYLQDLEKL
ncbi:hypothetical protein [Vitreoscilla stercoraria]|uniref:XRE family transcriptional regulator n=1 Tax=Vitreoscilla stercoraria TaxID=61 RepID=A0ABY4EC76_VITST|nr:hypothetical protein [Vitreoscilla stercoraria]UOO93352.1 hypothetical protein LVJ81_04810 [Vitreoscilla stercoraria]